MLRGSCCSNPKGPPQRGVECIQIDATHQVLSQVTYGLSSRVALNLGQN